MSGNFVTLNPQDCIADELAAGDIARLPGSDMMVVKAVTHMTKMVSIYGLFIAGNKKGLRYEGHDIDRETIVTRFRFNQ